MNRRAAIIHVLVCLAIGGIIASFSNARWLAASAWVSAALFLNGSLAMYEDARAGGFDNPRGDSTPAFTRGFGALAFWAKSLAVSLVLAALGFALQECS